MNQKPIALNREKLYKEVWSEPMVKVAKRYGISDVALAKNCKKMGIPMPGRGYWRKKETGHAVKQIPLPPFESRWKETVVLKQENQAMTSDDPFAELVEAEKLSEMKIDLSEEFDHEHDLVRDVRNVLKSGIKDEFGRLVSPNAETIDVNVSSANLDRALFVMNALLLSLEKRGFSISVDKEKKKTLVQILDESVPIRILEEIDRRETTQSARNRRSDEAKGWAPRYPVFEHYPSGRLVLEITHFDYSGSRGRWGDTKKRRIENLLNGFIVGMIKAASRIKKEREKDERREIERQMRERKETERNQLRQIEERKRWALISAAELWITAEKIRAFTKAAVAAALANGGTIAKGGELDVWIKWAKKQADYIDPLSADAHSTKSDRYNRSSFMQKSAYEKTTFEILWDRIESRYSVNDDMT